MDGVTFGYRYCGALASAALGGVRLFRIRRSPVGLHTGRGVGSRARSSVAVVEFFVFGVAVFGTLFCVVLDRLYRRDRS